MIILKLAFLLVLVCSIPVFHAYGQLDDKPPQGVMRDGIVGVKFLDAYFGTSTERMEFGPGDKNVPFTVTFANATTTDTGDSVTCKIQAVGVAQNVGYTVQVGYDSTNALTFTAAS